MSAASYTWAEIIKAVILFAIELWKARKDGAAKVQEVADARTAAFIKARREGRPLDAHRILSGGPIDTPGMQDGTCSDAPV